jgi:hypothetical protein
MEAVRLIDGKECQTLEKSEIIALIEALCERPLEDGQADPPAELQVFCREAAKALSQAGNASSGGGPDTSADADRYTAALAALLSGSDAEPARRTVAEATLRSAAARLDAGSAAAFVDAIEQSPQTAPSHLVEEMLEADRAAATGLARRQGVGISALWRWIPGAWSARTWRMAAACTVLMVAGVASWSVYRLETDASVRGSAAPMAEKATVRRSLADAPAPPRPAIASTEPCGPGNQAGEAVNTETGAPAGASKANASAATNCSPTPDHQFADRPNEENKAIDARQQAEAARQAASARAGAAAAAKVGAAQAGREPGQGSVQADHSGPMFGSRPAATMSAPAAVPAARPAAPTGMK